VKNLLAFFGLVFLSLVTLLGVAALGYFFDWAGMMRLPQQAPALGEIADRASTLQAHAVRPQAVTVQAVGVGNAQWSNPLDIIPAATATNTPTHTPTPFPTATPIPPLEPAVYRAETLARLKELATWLERWLETNDRLATDPALMQDPAWRDQAAVALANAAEAGQALADVGPPPPEYLGVDSLLDLVKAELDGLRDQYGMALEYGSAEAFQTAADHFQRLKIYLTQAAEEMVRLGWTIE
jgi:hypothetical protein